MDVGYENSLRDYPDVTNKPAKDLARNILKHSNWNETEVYSPKTEKLGDPDLLLESELFALDLRLDVQVPFYPNGKLDKFIDDIVSSGYFDKHRKRLSGASLFIYGSSVDLLIQMILFLGRA